MTLEIRHLRVLRAVSMEGTVTGAAEQLGFSPSAISQQLAALGRLFGQPVIRKDGRRIVLTTAGAGLALRADEILAAVSLAESEARATETSAGTLPVATFATAGRRLLVPAIRLVVAQHPGLTVEVVEGEPERTLPLLQSGAVDMALVYSYDLLPAEPPAISLFPLVDEQLSLVCSSELAAKLDGARDIVPTLRGLPWIAGPEHSGDREVTRRICGALGFEPRIAHSAEDYSLTLELAAAGLGVALVPVDAVAELPVGVRALAVPGVCTARHVAVAMQRHHERRPGNAALLAALRDTAAIVKSS